MKIGIVTDSTCDLNPQVIDKYNIQIVPLTVNFGDDVYKDGEDISSKEFFKKLNKSETLPTTSQPSAGLFIEKYNELKDTYDSIISIHLSRKLSGTYESARLAAGHISGIDIRIFDSASASLGLGFLVQLAAQLIDQGYNLDEVLQTLESARENVSIYFTVSDLTYLEKGGRIGKAQAFLGSIFNFNPIIKLNESGELIPLEKVRGNKKTRKKMIELVMDDISGENNAWIGILYGQMDNKIKKFKESLTIHLDNSETLEYITEMNVISPILGCHTGPSVYGAAVLKGDILKK